MSADFSFEKLFAAVASMSKNEVKNKILHFTGRPGLDFTEEYLDNLNLDRLRHILLSALLVHAGKH